MSRVNPIGTSGRPDNLPGVNEVGSRHPFYIVAEHRHGDKHSLSLSNTPDFDDQPAEIVELIREAEPPPRDTCEAPEDSPGSAHLRGATGSEDLCPIVLCGSTRFKEDFEAISAQLTLEGHIVLGPTVFSHADNLNLSDEDLLILREVHRRKIDLASAVYVVRPDYIGDGLAEELEYARSKGKPILLIVRVVHPSGKMSAPARILEPSRRSGHLTKHNQRRWRD